MRTDLLRPRRIEHIVAHHQDDLADGAPVSLGLHELVVHSSEDHAHVPAGHSADDVRAEGKGDECPARPIVPATAEEGGPEHPDASEKTSEVELGRGQSTDVLERHW